MKLWNATIPYYNPDADTPNTLTPYLIDTDEPRPCVIVMPGGAYGGRAYHEGEPVAQFFNSKGIHAAVLDYRVTPNYHPAPLADAQRAIRTVRANAKAWNVDPNRIVVCGFSAGGHLAASSLVLPNSYEATDEIDNESCKPNGAILCYPVISVSEDIGHVGSGKNLLGDRYEAEKDKYELSQYVTADTPPVFLWHTSTDGSVSVKNSFTFADKMRDHNVPFELHVFPVGKHGLGLATAFSDISKWAELAADWVERTV